MSKSLVIAEKPSVAKEIAAALGVSKHNKQFIENNQYIITWAFGHLVSLAEPERYDSKYQNWVLEDLPIIPQKFKLMTLKGAGGQFNAIKKMLSRGDVNQVIIATDAGREGELVARWILHFAGNKKPIKRLWISSVTKKAIIKGFSCLKDGRAYDNLFHAAEARAEADWILGINATRALTTKFGTPLSCGRVQTPTVAMVKMREDAIKKFKPKDYFGLTLETNGDIFTWQNKQNQTSTFNENLVQNIHKQIQNSEPKIVSITKKTKKSYPDALYDLTTLQKEAFSRYHYSPKATLGYMQALYEQHKALTYPRTDARYLTSDMKETINERLSAVTDSEYKETANRLVKSDKRMGAHIFNDAKVSDHHAIIPTEEPVRTSAFSREEWTIYEMVLIRFLENLMPPRIYDEEIITAKVADEVFTLKRKRDVSLGYKSITVKDAQTEKQSIYKNGDCIKRFSLKITKGQTKPPAYYNEGTLLAAMENPSQYTDDKELSSVLKSTGGIGTVATRADVIDKLFYGGLLQKSGDAIRVTNKGKQLLDVAPKALKSPELTAQWELKLQNIEKGKVKHHTFLDDIKSYTHQTINAIKGSEKVFKYDNKLTDACPDCGGTMVLQAGKNGKSHVCVNHACGYRKTVERMINARCPECKKKLTMRITSSGKIYTCSCGFKEGHEAFDKRMKKAKSSGGKRDFIAYQKKQAAEEKNNQVENNPFAQALKGLKLED